MIVRRERPDDHAAARAVQGAAFGGIECAEVLLLDALRQCEGWIPALSIVAEIDGVVVGHAVSTRATVDGVACVGFGPLGVRPDVQRAGVGSAIVHAMIGAADALDEPLIALLGSTDYYSRFGFRPASTLGVTAPEPTWGDHFQVLPLTTWSPAIVGSFRYAAPFEDL